MPKVNLGLIIFALIIVFGVLYLWTVSDVSTKGYEIRALDKKLVEARERTARFELEAAELRSARQIEGVAKNQGMVPSAGVNYVKDEGYALQR